MTRAPTANPTPACRGRRRASVGVATRRRRGITLAELLLVVAIIGTVAAIATPRYATSINSHRADGAARRIVADLGLAQTIARTENRSVRVKFDPNDEKYFFVGEPDPLQDGTDYTVVLSEAPFTVNLVGVSFDGRKELAFDPFGAAVKHDNGKPFEAAGTIVVQAGVAIRTIIVDQPTGRATIQ